VRFAATLTDSSTSAATSESGARKAGRLRLRKG
jgi:hypothetical protein